MNGTREAVGSEVERQGGSSKSPNTKVGTRTGVVDAISQPDKGITKAIPISF
jgi:hypothetical protein